MHGHIKIPVRSEVWVREVDKFHKDTPKLWKPCSYDGTAVDHGPLLTNKET